MAPGPSSLRAAPPPPPTQVRGPPVLLQGWWLGLEAAAWSVRSPPLRLGPNVPPTHRNLSPLLVIIAEPFAMFFDFVALGDGEEALAEIGQ